MKDWSTELIQQEDGKLYFNTEDGLIEASLTDVCKHYRNMQYNLITTLGNWATDCINEVEPNLKERAFWKLEYCEQPDCCIRIK